MTPPRGTASCAAPRPRGARWRKADLIRKRAISLSGETFTVEAMEIAKTEGCDVVAVHEFFWTNASPAPRVGAFATQPWDNDTPCEPPAGLLIGPRGKPAEQFATKQTKFRSISVRAER